MLILKILLIAIEVIVGLLLIGIILLQRSKEHGPGLAFGASMGESLFGSQAVNVLVKITVVLATVFFLNTVVLARMSTTTRRGDIEVPRLAPTQPQPPPAPAPVSETATIPSMTPTVTPTPLPAEAPAATAPVAPAPGPVATPPPSGAGPTEGTPRQP